MVEALCVGTGHSLGFTVVKACELILSIDRKAFGKTFSLDEDELQKAVKEEMVDLDDVAVHVKAQVMQHHDVGCSVKLEPDLIGSVFFGSPTRFSIADVCLKLLSLSGGEVGKLKVFF